MVTHGWLNAVHKMGMVDPISGVLLAGAAVVASLVILLRRIAGVCFNIKHQADIESAKMVLATISTY
eukprot:COSAG02_NODE_237_length_27732_cov_9.584374_16_plen_67_part_00